MNSSYQFVWKTKDEITQKDKDAIHFLAMTFYPEGRAAYEKNYWYSSIEPDALLFLYDGGRMISYSKFVVNYINVESCKVKLAGFSLLTHGDYQRQGIAAAMVNQLQSSMEEKEVAILYATTIFSHVKRILERHSFAKVTPTVTFIHAQTGKKIHETETVYIYCHDKDLLREIQQEKEFFIGKGPM